MSSPAGASGSTGHARQSAAPPTTPCTAISARTPPTPPARTPTTNTTASALKATKQPSSGSLSSRTMGLAKSFESTRSSRGSKDSLNSRNGKSSATPPSPSPSDEQLKSLRGEFDSLRTIVTCKICYGLLYEPYTTSCGHTYCYACFCKSFQPNTVPSCPECRGRLVNAPAPAFLVREMTAAFLRRPELLPHGENLEMHKGWQKEHADIIQADKSNEDARHGGLWRGVFRRRVRRMPPMIDEEDGVTRCPYCGWELEDGSCNRCGLPFDENGTGDWEFSDLEMASENGFMGGHDLVFEEYDMEDDFDEESVAWDEHYDDDQEEGPGPHYQHPLGVTGPYDQPYSIQRMLGGRRNHPTNSRRIAAHSQAGSRSRYSASVQESEMGTLEEEDEDEDSSMSGFIERDDGPNRLTRESTTTTDSRSSSAFPQSILEGNEEDEDDQGPIAPIRHRTQTSTSTTTAGSRQRPNSRTYVPPIQAPRRRRVISETPSSTSASTTPAEEEEADEEDQRPQPPANRRRRRGTSSEEPVRRVRPRARSNSTAEATEDSDPWGYRPLGTPQTGEGEDEQSDGGRTAVGWEPITSSNERTRNTGSLTPTADRPQAPPRPASRTSFSRFPLGSRGIRRRSSILSVSTVHYEDNDADDDTSGAEQIEAVHVQNTLHSQPSRIRLQNRTPQPIPRPNLQQVRTAVNDQEFDSDDTEPSPMRNGRQVPQRRAAYNPHISLMLAQLQTDLQASDAERPVYAEFEHLRGLSRTPLARPRTANRNRGIPTPQGISNQSPGMPSPGYVPRNSQTMYNPTRFRNVVDTTSPVASHANQTARSGTSNLPRLGGIDAMLANNTTRFRSIADVLPSVSSHISEQYSSSPRNTWDERVAARNGILPRTTIGTHMAPPSVSPSTLRSQDQAPADVHINSSTFPRPVDVIDRPTSRVNYRAGTAISRPPSSINRPPSASSRRGSLNRSAFPAPPMGPAGVGLHTARIFQNNNPFLNAIRPRPSSQRLRHEPSAQTLRQRPSVQVMRNQPPQAPSPDADLESPQMRPQASRLHLRPQISYRRLQPQRDPNNGLPQTTNSQRVQRDAIFGVPQSTLPSSRPQMQRDPSIGVPPQTSSPSGQRYSPRGTSTLSEDERSRRANELIRRRGEELAQLSTEQRAAAREVLQQRLASTMNRAPQAPGLSTTTSTTTTNSNMQGSGVEQGRGGRTHLTAISPPTSATTLQTSSPAAQQRARNALPLPATVEARMSTMAPAVAPLTTGGDRRRN